ncbi:MAG: hypothetical protein QM754_12875 [Tepidisphaeraceae bacterium]
MIYEPVMTPREGGVTLLHRHFTWEDVIMRPLIGLFLLGIGSLILYVFYTGGAPHPTGQGLHLILGWLFITVIFLLFGVMPIVLGIQVLARSDEIIVDSAAARVEHRIKLAQQTVFRRRLSFGQFNSLTVEHSRGGFPVSRARYSLVAKGVRRLAVGHFDDARSAADFRDRLSSLMRLPQQNSAGGSAVA